MTNRVQMIASTENRLFKLVKSLVKGKYRREYGLFGAEGLRLVKELIEAKLVPEHVLVTEEFMQSPEGVGLMRALPDGVQAFLLGPDLFAKLAETVQPQGVIGVFPIPTVTQEEIFRPGAGHKPWILCLDRLQDPGNLGTIIRSASAFGFTLVLSKGCVDPFNPKVVRSSMGELARVPILTEVELPEFMTTAAPKLPIYATTPHSGASIVTAKRDRGCVLIIGNEAQGISPEVAEITERTFFIPMFSGTESLNAAVAAAVAMYELVREDLGIVLSPHVPL